MKKNNNRFMFFALILTFSFFLVSFSAAQEIKYTPKLDLSGEYNDNIFFSNTDKADDFILNISPSIELNYVSELMDLYSLASVWFRKYLSENDLDREDYYLNLGGKYRLTEKTLLRSSLSYIQDYALESRVFDLIETPIDEVPIDEEEIVERGIERFLSERKRYNAFASMNHRLTSISNLNFSYRYLKIDYDLEQNKDYETNDLNLAYIRRLAGQRDQVGTSFSYRQRTSDVSDTDSYEIGLIWNHLFTEIISLYTNIGVRYTEQTFKDTSRKSDNWRPTANIRLRKRGETNVVDIGFRQDLYTASDGEVVNVSRLYWDARQIINERIFFEIEGDFYIRRNDSNSTFESDFMFFDISPSLRYWLTANHSVSLFYNYTIDYDRTLDTDRDTQRNRVWIMFEFGFPSKW